MTGKGRLRGQHMTATARYAAQAAFLAALSGASASWSVRSTCRVTGLGKSTVYRWAASDHHFAAQLRARRALPVPVPSVPTLTRAHELLLSLGPEPESAAMALLADEVNASLSLMEAEVSLSAVEEEAPARPLLAETEQEEHLTAAGEQLLAYLRSLA